MKISRLKEILTSHANSVSAQPSEMEMSFSDAAEGIVRHTTDTSLRVGFAPNTPKYP
ncbi:MAG TPA: hypothetical protein PKI93_00385 [Alphaproteobacteria bacterium]|nr:hypothetical protein [Alphaproteobacteria bacterium]HNS43791.1 hypothetical protein [Alphaproteobacteria bacterium]